LVDVNVGIDNVVSKRFQQLAHSALQDAEVPMSTLIPPMPELDPDGHRLPVKLDSTSNGEFAPVPLDDSHRHANHLAREWAGELAKKLGQGRRAFLTTLSGAASTLLAINSAHARAGRTGGFIEIANDARLEPQVAAAQLGKQEFIFDVQGHFVNPTGAWTRRLPPGAKPLQMPNTNCALSKQPGERSYLNCIGPDEFIKDVFLDSDTDLMVLSFVPSTREDEPLTIEEATATRDIVAKMEGSKRLMLHGRVNPNQPGDIEDMERLVKFGVVAFKTYTQWGPSGKGGFYMTDDVGVAFVEKARQLGVRNICIHKGLDFGPRSYEHSTCRDIGPIAKQFPDMNFLIYHSGFVSSKPEGPYDPRRTDGIDALDSAAHAMGKLFKFIGEDNVLWGTDSIWYGSPQDQIQAFRTFQIAEPLREKFGYPAMTPQLRAKVFGLNATRPYKLAADELRRFTAKDAVARSREEYRPNPSYVTHGPRTRREFLNLRVWHAGEP
jgi:uncharacterized protein